MTIVSHDADTRVVSSHPDSHIWASFLFLPTSTYFGECVAECGLPWSLNLVTRELRQCGCPEFTPDVPHVPMAAAILAGLDVTPKPRRARWALLGCDDLDGCGSGVVALETVAMEFVPCHSCGWTPDLRTPDWRYTA